MRQLRAGARQTRGPAPGWDEDWLFIDRERHRNGALRHLWQTARNNGWSGWEDLGRPA